MTSSSAAPRGTVPRGMDPVPLERAWDLVVRRGAPAQLCVIRDGQVVLDRSYRCEPDALFWIFSAGKPYTAMLVHLLAERGELSLDDPIARWWPEFAQHGKGGITVRHVLQHRAGLPTAGSFLGDALAIADWDRSVHRIERAHPRWRAGEVPAYEILTFGFILGELVRRVTGVPVAELLRTEILEPLGVHDTYLGLPDSAWSRHVPLRIRGPLGLPVQVVLNQQRTRRAVIPSAGISTTARDLGAFYDMLLNDGRVRLAVPDGEPSGTVILHAETVAAARVATSHDEVDRFAGFAMRWSQGFQLGGDGSPADLRGSLGRLNRPRAFGHNGSSCCIGWADPDSGIAFAYLTNRFDGRRAGADHQLALAGAVLEACRQV
ncbi:MAG TPA: serine hydrolase domain-containing protein [Cellulomonadaceae bacterium]|nr:serine hydrolase domain-containing protein [Cellulomonadaceae bacterium]